MAIPEAVSDPTSVRWVDPSAELVEVATNNKLDVELNVPAVNPGV